MACQLLASGTGFDNQCLSWVQERLRLSHEYPTAADAWSGYSGRGAATSNPQPNDLVFFGRGPINGNAGHVGIVRGGGTFESVLSDGGDYTCGISDFAAQNGVGVSGYVSLAALNGTPATVATAPGNAVVSGVSTLVDSVGASGAGFGGLVLIGGLALLALVGLDSVS